MDEEAQLQVRGITYEKHCDLSLVNYIVVNSVSRVTTDVCKSEALLLCRVMDILRSLVVLSFEMHFNIMLLIIQTC